MDFEIDLEWPTKIHNPYGFFMDFIFIWIVNFYDWIWIEDSEEHGLWIGYGFVFKSILTH